MSWLQFVTDFDNYWSTITFILAALFVVGYGLGSPWYRSPFGRSMLILDFGLAVATFPAFLNFIFDINLMDNRAMGWIIIISASFIPIAIAYRLYVLWSVRNRKFWRYIKNDHKPRSLHTERDSTCKPEE